MHVAYTWPSATGEPLHLIHRDIKPSNLLLTAAGEVKVLDFGIARASFSAREAYTKSVLFGSPGYMAPERLDFEEGPAGDVYSLGVVLAELLTGQAFGKTAAKPEKHRALVQAMSANLARAGIDGPTVEAIEAMLAYEPEQRPSARELETRCRELRARYGTPWLRDWAEDKVPPLLTKRGLDGRHSFSNSVVVERSGSSFGFEGNNLSAASTYNEEERDSGAVVSSSPMGVASTTFALPADPGRSKRLPPPPTAPGRPPRLNSPPPRPPAPSQPPPPIRARPPRAGVSMLTWVALVALTLFFGTWAALLFLLMLFGALASEW